MIDCYDWKPNKVSIEKSCRHISAEHMKKREISTGIFKNCFNATEEAEN